MGTEDGIYALMSPISGYQRAILVTPQFEVNKHGFVCFSIAIFKPGDNSKSLLEVFQGEMDSFGEKLWQWTDSISSEWKVAEIQAKPKRSSSQGLYFYIVSNVFCIKKILFLAFVGWNITVN